MDNKPVLNIFKLLVEDRSKCKKLKEKFKMGFLTKNANMEQKKLIHPFEKLVLNGTAWPGMISSFGTDHENYEEFEVVAMRKVHHVEDNAIGIVIHKTNFEDCETSEAKMLNLKKLLGLRSRDIYKSTITLLEQKEKIGNDDVLMCSMDTRGFVMK
jgi:hypothetical protein